MTVVAPVGTVPGGTETKARLAPTETEALLVSAGVGTGFETIASFGNTRGGSTMASLEHATIQADAITAAPRLSDRRKSELVRSGRIMILTLDGHESLICSL